MRHVSFRLPEYLYYGIKDFGEPKGMALSESVRFITPIFTAGLIVKVTPQSSGPDYLHGFTGKPWNSKRFL